MTAATVAALAVVQVLFAVSWFGAVPVPGAVVSRVVVVLTALGADVTVLATDVSRPMANVPPVLAGALLAALLQQLARRGGRERLTPSLTATTAAAAFAGLGSAWLALQASQQGSALVVLAVVAAGAASAAALAGRSVPGPAWAAPAVAAVLAVLAAAVVAGVSDVGLVVAMVTGSAGAAAARLGVVVAVRTESPEPLLVATLPALLVAPVAYLLARVLLG